MQKYITEYLDKLAAKLKQGNATEHTYRGDLQLLTESMFSDISATNEPKRIACGAPDYILLREDIPVGYIEAKDIDAVLRDKKHQEQFNRYKSSLDNLIITNYVDFELFVNGEYVDSVSIARIDGNKLTALTDNFAKFTELLKTFTGYHGQTIKSTVALSKMMAQESKLLAQAIWNFYIGGYQPAQKWLKDRKNKQLSYDDIMHYMKIITVLSLTDTIMSQTNEVVSYE